MGASRQDDWLQGKIGRLRGRLAAESVRQQQMLD